MFNKFGITEYDAEVLTIERDSADFFEEVVILDYLEFLTLLYLSDQIIH